MSEIKCGCRKCHSERVRAEIAADPQRERHIFMASQRFIVCETCGNKRCPHATDHNLACTGSNEPGQKGSAYE